MHRNSPKMATQSPPMTEAMREAQKINRADVERFRAFEVMMKTEGWGLYVELLNHHINARMENYLQPTAPGGRDIEQHNKGTVFGLILARDLPSGTVTSMQEAIAASNAGNFPAEDDE